MSTALFTTSKARAFEDALIAQLQARDDLAGVQVEIGPLGPDDTDAGESVQSYGCEVLEDWQMLGATRREETLRLTGQLKVDKPGGGAAVIRLAGDRAWELLGIIAHQLREDPHVNGTVHNAGIVRSQEGRGSLSDGVRRSVIEFTIEAKASLGRK